MHDQVRQCFSRHQEILCCPRCQSSLAVGEHDIACPSCDHHFGVQDNIPLLFSPSEWDASKERVAERVRTFYEGTPFPNYDDFDSVGSLREKARQGLFAHLLDEQVPLGARVLECGCGTAQLSLFLGIAPRTVFGTDVCVNSLRLGQAFKERHGLSGVHLLQMNLFRPVFRPGSFDLVICNGVLHHTPDPLLGLKTIAALARPGGFVLVGLYHRFGRVITNTRRVLFRLFGQRLAFLDPNLRARRASPARRRAWFMDQYQHPHESHHTIGEVLEWLPQAGLQFVKSVPRTVPFQPFSEAERLFADEVPGNRLERLVVELGMAFSGSRQGGFFVVIARRR
ncbi:MAG: methyltransferase domain-containing protein [Chloroflexi bacterium]|nr:methyltransferase domain-containing protein [Chloroflexota bacterium]